MADISKIKLPGDNTEYTIKDSGAARSSHSHTKSEITDFSHNHDERYYTEDEIDSKLNSKLNSSLKGVNNGIAELDSTGKVPSSQLPSYVDDVLEFNSQSNFPSTGETGKIYIAKDTNKTYRWSGTNYVEISTSLALGETSSTAYRGDRGKIAYDHSQTSHAPSNAEANQNAFSNVKVGSTTVAADSKTDTLTLAGSNVTLTPDATNDKITIGITKTNVTDALGYTPPTTNTTYGAAGTSLGLVKSGGDVSISSGVITVNDDSHNHVISNVDGLQDALDAKGSESDVSNLKTLVGDTSVSSQITSALTSYEPKSNVTSKGSATQPVYFDSNGVAQPTTYTLGKSVPSNAVFTDTTYSAGTGLSLSNKIFSINSSVITKGDTLQTTNPFGGKQLYISKIDNAFYAADKRWTVTGSYTGARSGTYSAGQLSNLFDGNYENTLTIFKGCTAKIRITFNTDYESDTYNGIKVFPGYPYGYVYLSYYYINTPSTSSKMRVYCNYNDHGIGEHEYTMSLHTGSYPSPGASSGTSLVEVVRQPVYAVSYIEFEITGATNYDVYLSQIEIKLDRPDSAKTPFLSKYGSEKLYYPLTAPLFKGNLEGNATTATTANKVANTLTIQGNGTTLTNGTFDGSTAKTVNITPASIGAATSSHTHDNRYYTESEIDTKLSGKSDTSHTHSSYVNQNAFSNVKVGNSTIAADSATDTLTLTAGTNVTLTPDATNDKVTITAKDTTYSAATTSAAGLMSATDKTKLDGIATGANKTTVDSALSSTSTNPVQNKVVNTAISNLNTLVGDTAVSTQITNAIDEITPASIGAATSSHTHSGYASTSHTHNYAGSSSAGGAANSVANSMTVQLNGGTTEGTNKFTFNGSAAKSVNITPSTIGAAASSHGTHVSYSSTNPVMDGTASVGSASTVARSDHKHPTDTTRAAASDLTSHTGNTSNPHQVTAAQVGADPSGSASSALTSAKAYTDDEISEWVGDTTVSAQIAAAAYTHPSYTARTGVPTANQTPAFGGTFSVNQINSDATGHVTAANSRTVTIPSTLSNGTGTAGLIKTSSTVTSNSGYTACPVISGVPYYKDTNTTYTLSSFGVTATAAELNVLDGITSTVTELNYCDGVTSNIQTQLDGKASSSHNHSASNITSGTLEVARGGTGKATHTSNAVLIGNGTSAVNNVATASGALYATSANGAPKFGTLPIAQGGTGATTASAARTNLGVAGYEEVAGTPTATPLGIAYGGTGATTAAVARTNLNVPSIDKIKAILFTSYTETLTVTNGTFTNDGCDAILVGNMLYLYFKVTAKAAKPAGNISNETMITLAFVDNRISQLYSSTTSGGSYGPNSQMQFSTESSNGQHTITVTLAALAQNIAKGGVINAHVSFPCALNWDAY